MGVIDRRSRLRHSSSCPRTEELALAFDIHPISDANSALLDMVAPDVFDSPIHPQMLAAFCNQPGHFLAVATIDRLVVGQVRAILHLSPDEPAVLYIDNLGVTPKHKRKGIARALMQSALEWGHARGARSFWVATEIDNAEARAFYASLSLDEQPVAYFEGRI